MNLFFVMANENTRFGGLNFFLVILSEITTQCVRNMERQGSCTLFMHFVLFCFVCFGGDNDLIFDG